MGIQAFFDTRLSRFLLLVVLMVGLQACFVINDIRQYRASQRPAPKEFIQVNYGEGGYPLTILFSKGPAHNHPLMALWIEDLEGNFIQTLFVAESVGRGVFRHGDPSEGFWQPGPVRRPAALPYWGHQRGIRANDGYFIPTKDTPVADAITGPTPKSDFELTTHTPGHTLRQFRLLFEINQAWNWNNYWTNNKFPDNVHYASSGQPALVYEAIIDLDSRNKVFSMVPIGHSHWSGENGELFRDISTLSTALEIVSSILVVIPSQ